MNITSNYIDDLNGKIIIEVEQKDYSEQVNSVLKKYSKSANIPVIFDPKLTGFQICSLKIL